MRFHDADDDVDPLALEAMGLLQHFVGLADARREAEIDLQPPPLLLADHRQKALGGGFLMIEAHANTPSSKLNTSRNSLERGWKLSDGRFPQGRQTNAKLGPLPRMAFAGDRAAMRRDDFLDDGQSQTGARPLALPGNAEEFFEDVRQRVGRNADARVANGQFHLVADGPAPRVIRPPRSV